MEIKDILNTRTHRKVQKGPCHTFLFSIISNGTSDEEVIDFDIDDLATVQFKFKNTGDDGGSHVTYVTIIKHESGRDSEVRINVTCGTKTLQSQCNWKLLSKTTVEYKHGVFISDLEVSVLVQKVKIVGFGSLYDDTDFTDFKLSALDGKVNVHRACLAAHSDYFKRMLAGQWKETLEGCIEMVGLNVINLRHLKEYLYLGTLPEDPTELRPLLLLADICFIDHLKTECIIKLVQSATAENYFSLHDFACGYNIPQLSIAIRNLAPDNVVNEAYQLKTRDNLKQCQ